MKKGKPSRTSAELATAYHEAGHAVAAWRLGVAFRRRALTIVADDDAAGRFRHRDIWGQIRPDVEASDRARVRAEKEAVLALAGMEAQRRFSPRSVRHFHAASDYRNAVDILSYFTGSNEELEAYLKLLRIRTAKMFEFTPVWNCVQALAELLALKKTMSAQEVLQVLKDTISQSSKVHG